MSKLGIAITITIASGIVVGGLVLDKQKQESSSIKSSVHMVVMPDGCPPCRSIADKYGRGWIGHEDECDQ